MSNDPQFPKDDAATVAATAARWVLRHDRGLTAAEQDEFSHWLAADRAHGAAFAEHRAGWDELDRLVGLQTSVAAMPDPDLLAPSRREFAATARRYSPWLLAAAVVLGFFALRPRPAPPLPVPAALFARIEQRTLEDGSSISLNRGAIIAVEYSAAVRRVRLVRGEAHFTVAKNPARPFVVSAGGVDVRAVGTAFNVQLGATAVEVLVTEGSVGVERSDRSAPHPAGAPAPSLHLRAGEQTAVPLVATPAAPTPPVAALTPPEIEARLAWQPRMLDFTAAPLAEIVTVFNQHNPVQIVVSDPALGAVRLSASFKSDNLEGFVRLMESDFGMRAERRDARSIVLHRVQ